MQQMRTLKKASWGRPDYLTTADRGSHSEQVPGSYGRGCRCGLSGLLRSRRLVGCITLRRLGFCIA